MNKKTLHEIFTGTELNTVMKINFLQEFKDLSGEYKLLSVRAGRGKGGSRIVSLMNTATGETLETVNINGKPHKMGTSVSEYVLNIEVNGHLYGDATALELPRGFARDAVAAKALRTELERLFDKEGSRIAIDSTEPAFNGSWTIDRIRFSPGRFGQVILNISDADTNRRAEIWSYRHASVIRSIALVS